VARVRGWGSAQPPTPPSVRFRANTGPFYNLSGIPGECSKAICPKKELVSKWSGREAMGKNVKRASFAISEWNAATRLVHIPCIFPTMGDWGSKPSVGATPEEDSSTLAGHTNPTKIVFRAQVERCWSRAHSIAQAYVQGLSYAARVWGLGSAPHPSIGLASGPMGAHCTTCQASLVNVDRQLDLKHGSQ